MTELQAKLKGGIRAIALAREDLDDIITDPNIPDEYVLQANAAANELSDIETRLALRWSLAITGKPR